MLVPLKHFLACTKLSHNNQCLREQASDVSVCISYQKPLSCESELCLFIACFLWGWDLRTSVNLPNWLANTQCMKTPQNATDLAKYSYILFWSISNIFLGTELWRTQLEKILRCLPAAGTMYVHLHSRQLIHHLASPQESQDLLPLIPTQVKPKKLNVSGCSWKSMKRLKPQRRKEWEVMVLGSYCHWLWVYCSN